MEEEEEEEEWAVWSKQTEIEKSPNSKIVVSPLPHFYIVVPPGDQLKFTGYSLFPLIS